MMGAVTRARTSVTKRAKIRRSLAVYPEAAGAAHTYITRELKS